MTKLSKTLISVFILIAGLFFSASKAHADVITSPLINAMTIANLLIAVGIVVSFITVMSLLVIRGIRRIIRKKNVVNK